MTLNVWSCWPAVTRSGAPAFWASYSIPMAFPRPGATWTLTTPSFPDAWAYPSAIATTAASWSAST